MKRIVTITIEGEPKTGKSTLMFLISRVLQEKGISVQGFDIDNGNIPDRLSNIPVTLDDRLLHLKDAVHVDLVHKQVR